MNNSEYWAKRFKALEESTYAHSEDWLKSAERQFRTSLVAINDKIAWFYTLFEETSGMSHADARRVLDKKNLRAFKLSVQEYIKLGKSLDTYFDSATLKELVMASSRVRISRYDAIKYYIKAEIAGLFGKIEKDGYIRRAEAYENRYYSTAHAMQSMGTSFARLNKKQIDVALAKPWKDTTFSASIWENNRKLQRNLTDTITQSIIHGESYTQATNDLERRMKVGNSNCARVITTEMAAVSSKAQQEIFKELDVKEYEIVATLDRRTSEICQSLDGERFKQSEYEVGVTAPPFHPRCRSVASPVTNIPRKRIARDKNGKSVFVENMTYLEWAEANNIEPIYGLWKPEKKK